MSTAEMVRTKVVEDLFKINCVGNVWPVWQPQIRATAMNPPTAASLLNLGSSLSTVFATTNIGGRNQSSQSVGGTLWEALVCWYLNLCLIGTRAVVAKKTSHLPAPIRDALTVTYGNVKTNSESDLVAITFPSNPKLDQFTGPYSGKSKIILDEHISQLLGQIEVCVVQCKTNWNENAQIPMLWDMVYSATAFAGGRVHVGINGHSVLSLKRFSYAFATVPTQKDLSKFNKTATPVLRVSNLSGGNYWGQPARNGVAGSIGDIFNKNFASATLSLGQPWQNHLNSQLHHLFTRYAYFRF